ncbi:MAG: tetratricopeptide repeat protein [Acidobacteria bacterium]|nr:tetratricopeptide repeat protein [Acidobacteriota bacterium]
MFLQNFSKKRHFLALLAAIAFTAAAVELTAQQNRRAATFDVKGYVIDAKLLPDENKLDATVDVTFVLLEDLRSVAFELNGSLKIDSIVRVNSAAPASPAPTPTRGRQPRPTPTPRGPEVTFVQDQVGVSELGPSVRIDLGEQVAKDTPVTLRFKYSGVLNTPSGGPLLNKRLAYVGEVNGYLFYAARWFPFHDYAADRATADITVTLPGNFQVVGHSDTDVPATPTGKYRFIQSRPGLVGNIAYGRYTNRNLQIGGYELKFYTRPGSTENVEAYAETIGKALEYYTKQFGEPEMGRDLAIVQIDDESLDFYSGPGITFVSDRQFTEPRNVTEERLQREAAYQWWGLTVGLKSFDDAWLSQGLAEYSAFAFREANATGAQLDGLRRELVEKSLTFEQTASLLRAPANLDDQSTAYKYIMYGKGAMVFRLLRETMGMQKFDQLLKAYLEEFRGKNASIDEFERLTSRVAGQNMRYFFARWVESTGVPEFTADYVILRNRAGKFIARGTVKQNYDNLRLPVEIQLKFEGENGFKTERLQIDDASADFNMEVDGKPLEVIIDPGFKLLWISPELRVTSIARRGIELFKEGNYSEAQTQLENALKLDRSNSWIYYHLGLLFLEQRNYELAKENFQAALRGNLNPPWLEAWAEIKLGNAYDAQGDRTRAIAAYDRAEKTGIEYDNALDAIARFKATPYDPRAGDVN